VIHILDFDAGLSGERPARLANRVRPLRRGLAAGARERGAVKGEQRGGDRRDWMRKPE